MSREKDYINETQHILQSYDKGLISGKSSAKIYLEKLFPLLDEKNLRHVLCQCYDKMFYTESEIKRKWLFDVWEEKGKIKNGKNS